MEQAPAVHAEPKQSMGRAWDSLFGSSDPQAAAAVAADPWRWYRIIGLGMLPFLLRVMLRSCGFTPPNRFPDASAEARRRAGRGAAAHED